MTPKNLHFVVLHFAVDKFFKTKDSPNMETDFWSRVERVAQELSVPSKTFETWKRRGKVPAARRFEIAEAAKQIRIRLTYKDLNSVQ